MIRKFTFIRALSTVIGVLLLAIVSQAQTLKITGTVVSGDDQTPVAGASVLVKGTTNGVQTNLNGTFSIQASGSDILVFQSLGYITQEVPVKGKTVIDVTIKQNVQNLNEVLVTGYSTQSRSTTTSAIAKLDNEVLATAPRANIASALQGTISGVQVINASGSPGSQPYMVLRGGATISSPSSPLVVVDGVQRSSYQDIPEEDIASIDVLKDAAATAIYGAKANNGVILITTKKGKVGTSQISYKLTAGFNSQRQGYNYVDAADYIYYARLGRVNNFEGLNSTTSITPAQLATINSTRGYGLLTDPANLGSFDIQAETPANIGLLQQGWQDIDDPANPGNRIIFKDHSGEIASALFRNTTTMDHYINASGGSAQGTYFASFDYYNEPGVVVGASYDRYAGNFNGSYKIKPNLEIITGITFSTSSQYGPGAGDVNTFYRTLSLWPTFNPWLDAAKTQPNPGNANGDGNPLYWLGKTINKNEKDGFVANAALIWTIQPGLSFKVSGSGFLNQSIGQNFQDATQLYTNIFANPQTINNSTRPASASYSRNVQQTYDATLNYSKSFGKNSFTLLVAAEYLDNTAFNNIVSGSGAPTDDISTVNASTIFAAGSGNSSQNSENRTISTFATLNYNFDQKYLLNAVIREDGVSVLAYSKRIGYFPGMSAGWNVHREDFFKKSAISKVISTLKPRISYGSNGNVNSLSNYGVQGVYNITSVPYNGNGGITNTSPTNDNLQWETSNTKGAGLDLGLFNDRITLIFDYYDRVTSDLLTPLPLPSYLGYGTITTNDGSYQNKGIEFALKANIINNPGGFRLDFGANASHNVNKVLKLPYNGQPNNRQNVSLVWDPKNPSQTIAVGGVQEGQTLGQIYGFKELGIFKDAAQVAAVAGNRVDNVANISGPNAAPLAGGRIGPGDVNWLDVNGDGIIDSRDQVYLGNVNPTWTGGFNFNASYKNLSLYTRFNYSLGSTVYNDLVPRSLGGYQGTFSFIDEIKNAWTPTNTNTMIPKVYYADQVAGSKDNYTRGNNANPNLGGENSQFYESGNYLGCQEITLSYNFPKALLAKSHAFSALRIYGSGESLFYIKKFSGPSPEAPVSGNSITGVYQGTYPTPRTYVLGLQASF